MSVYGATRKCTTCMGFQECIVGNFWACAHCDNRKTSAPSAPTAWTAPIEGNWYWAYVKHRRTSLQDKYVLKLSPLRVGKYIAPTLEGLLAKDRPEWAHGVHAARFVGVDFYDYFVFEPDINKYRDLP